jgi:hypothetical protein
MRASDDEDEEESQAKEGERAETASGGIHAATVERVSNRSLTSR